MSTKTTTGNLKTLFILAASAAALTVASAAHADNNANQLGVAWDFNSAGNSYTNGNWDLANNFTMNANRWVVGLGYWTGGVDSANGNSVSLYTSTGTLLATGVITAGDPQIGSFSYVSLTTPVLLSAGQSYQIAANNNNGTYTWSDSGFNVNSAVNLPGVDQATGHLELYGGGSSFIPGSPPYSGFDGIWGGDLVFKAAPGPIPGTGLLSFAVLALAGAATRLRGYLSI